jgi:hypothetical protein
MAQWCDIEAYDSENALAALESSRQGALPDPMPAEEQEATSTKLGAPAVSGVFCGMLLHPVRQLIRRWNWKSAVLSSLLRATIFSLRIW